MDIEEIIAIIFATLKQDERVACLKIVMGNKGIQICTIDGKIYNLGGSRTQRKFGGKIDYVKQLKDWK